MSPSILLADGVGQDQTTQNVQSDLDPNHPLSDATLPHHLFSKATKTYVYTSSNVESIEKVDMQLDYV